jgi:hypothetical protein
LHRAQLLARVNDILPRGIDRCPLLWRDHRRCGRLFIATRTLPQRTQLLFSVVQVLLQRLLCLAEFRFRLTLHRVHQHKRMIAVAARAQTDQCIPARQRAHQIGDERSVFAEWHCGLLAEEVGDPHPEAIRQDVAVGHHHQVRCTIGLRLELREVLWPLLILCHFGRPGEC